MNPLKTRGGAYATGLQGNPVLYRAAADLLTQAVKDFEATQQK